MREGEGWMWIAFVRADTLIFSNDSINSFTIIIILNTTTTTKTNSWDTKKNSNTTNENNENSAKWRDQKKIGKEKGNKSAFDLKFDSELNPISTYDDTLFRKKIQKKMIQKKMIQKLFSWSY